ncbi:phosphomannomutase/phosphoglucomutase [Thiomicrorhabdus sp. Milos-T2]|uniref:phosphomannomutase/phosphoglucomutase n=1 Tax=Thiomicrorhabdus sp. Milos-T2 TaxID=90814 RepID=UPI000493CF49|nr:phosphomannomutase/phosphoglucomutase [Thiomicrorhabdus sp. Milos-T2]
MTQVVESIFRMYDIRGVVDDVLTEETVELVGKALGSALLATGQDKIVLARDGRLSGPRFRDRMIAGLISTGVNVVDIGQVPTPMAYFAAATLEGVNSCVVITGSHNPSNYNGIKMVVDGITLYGDYIQNLLKRIQDNDFSEGSGSVIEQDIFQAYQSYIVNDIRLAKTLKIVVDGGNGVAGPFGVAVFRAMGCEVIELFCDIDGTFPNHHSDPAKPQNLADLVAAVKEEGADLGIAFDGDGDRCGIVDNSGNSLYADRQLMLYAQDVLSREPGGEIIYDIKCTSLLPKIIEQAGGKATIWKTGHSFMKAKMRETGAVLGGEVSGHIFWKERWFGFDDGIYTGARMCEIVAKSEQTAADLFATLPNGINTPELDMPFAEGEHYQFFNKFKELTQFTEGKVFDLDGLRVDFADGWGLIRPSNTSPIVTLRFEGETQAALDRIKALFREKILAVDSNLKLPF